ncbi:MAG: ABC transporter ATP-binding protein [Lachnospiraceae bacterium]|nr:ABC transporter ATP-binding protein [Lachnospiraceae bacterium]
MLEIQHLTKRYGKNTAVDDVSFTVETGRVGILLGPNGAGKSTVIKSIAGLLRYEGGIGIEGMPAKSMEAKRVFGYVPEIPALFQNLNVWEHMEYIRRAYNLDISDEEIHSVLRRFELDDKLDKLGNELSKGMMQKVSICCALIIKPRVLMLDEPMVGLDPKAIKELKEVILFLRKQGITILISTHMLEMVQELWDDVFMMQKGHIIASYRKEDVGDQNLDDLFFAVTEGGEDSGQEEGEKHE